MHLNLEDLETIGIPLERAERFLSEVKKDQERKESLLERLKEIHCEEIFHNLADAGSTLEELFSLDNDALEKFGIDLKQRKKILTKIQNARDADICKYQI